MACTDESIKYNFSHSLTYIGTRLEKTGSFMETPELRFTAKNRPFIQWNYDP
jgi:hypothetical protein